jgi:rRNA processing protein Gar1
LRRLNNILHIAKNGKLIFRLNSDTNLKIGERVFNSKLREVGKIQDIFGPVNSPYISITPKISDPLSLVGKVVYSE